MPVGDIFDIIQDLRTTDRPFCVATVVRTADSTSAKAGAKAAITETGEILGHLGGGCVQRAVRLAVAETLSAGLPQMIRVKPSERVIAMTDPDGVQTYKSGCPSGGTVDLLIEPYQLPPRLVIFGATPIGEALACHATMAGFRVCLSAQPKGGDLDGVQCFDPSQIADLGLEPQDFVVVASQGQGDLAALDQALATPARRVSMVASRRKAEVLCAKLSAKGVPAQRLADLKAPAGLDIHAIDPHEIALSILSETVMWRNAKRASDRALREQSA